MVQNDIRPDVRSESHDEGPVCPWPLPKRGIDLPLLVALIALIIFGWVMLYSASYIYAQEKTGDGFLFLKKQLLFGLIGISALVGATHYDVRRLQKWGYPILGGSIALLLLTFIPGLGARVGGAQRWVKLGGFGIQPAEFAKLGIVLFICSFLVKKQHVLQRFAPGVISPFLLPLPAFLLLLAQPDFGSVVIVSSVVFALLFLAGVPKRFLGVVLCSGAGLALSLAMSSGYRRERIMTFLDPWRDPGGKGFQIIQSMIGFSRGSFMGVGLGNGKEKLFYLPEAHNDFFFAVVGEELGFLGVLGVVGLFVFIVFRGLKIAHQCKTLYQDNYGMYLATGLTLLFGMQGMVNMAVVLGLLPTKGLNLPFLSYGGSSLIVNLFAVGLLLSLSRGPQKGVA